MTGLFVILTPLTKLFPTLPTPTRPDTLSRLLIFYLLWQLQSKQWLVIPGYPGLLTIDPTNCSVMTQTFHCHRIYRPWPIQISAMSSCYSLIGHSPQYRAPIGCRCLGSRGDSDYAYCCTLELLPLARANYWPLIGQGWTMVTSDWLVLAWCPSLIGHCVLITSHWTR